VPPEPGTPPKLPVLPEDPAEMVILSFEHWMELYWRGELAEPEEAAEKLLGPWRLGRKLGVEPAERGYKAVQAMKTYLLRLEAYYREHTGATVEGMVVPPPPQLGPGPPKIGAGGRAQKLAAYLAAALEHFEAEQGPVDAMELEEALQALQQRRPAKS
jgi:hypothetical protein